MIPNEKLASDTIRNFTIRSPEKVAEITVQVPLDQDLDAALEALRSETNGEVYVSSLGEKTAVVTHPRAGAAPWPTPTASRASCACGRTGGCAPPASSR